MSDELPRGWAVATLGELVSFALGGDWGKDPDELGCDLVKVRVVRGTEFKAWRMAGAATAAVRCIKMSSLEKRRLKKGDIVVEISGGGPNQPVGRTVFIDHETLKRIDLPLVCSNFFRLVRLHSCVESRLVNHFLNYAYSKGEFDEFQTETTNLRNLNFTDFLEKTEISVAPLNEQRRILAKLEKLLGNVDACRKRLAKIPIILKRFRQSVLAAACSGRLTADWRQENLDVDPATNLIREEQFHIVEPDRGLPYIPETWIWVALGNYGCCSRGRFSIRPRNDPTYFGGKHPFIQIGNLPPEGGWVKQHTQTLNEKGVSVSKKFPKGTAVIAIVGATIGNTGLLAYDMCFPDSLVGIETGTEEGNRYIELFLRSKKNELRLTSYSSGGQPNIKLETLNPYPLALPPYAEQCEIVRRVEALFALADQIEGRYRKAKDHVDMLTQSILARAFRGELVRQDPNDEPASVLLARLRRSRN